jgi:hypothetical protein
MVIRVAAKDVEGARLLVAGLAGLFGDEAVSLQPEGEVHLALNGRSGQQAVTQTLGVVERWLDKTGIDSTDVWVDERRYWMERPRPLDEQRKLGEDSVDFLGRVVVHHPDS